MPRLRFLSLLLIIGLCLMPISSIQAQTPVVRAVLFYSPTCGHCQEVIEQVLPELDREFGSQLVILGINTHTETGNILFNAYVEHFQIPEDLQAVPTLVVGDTYLIGSQSIPDELPAITREGLDSGGIDWPDIPGLDDALQSLETSEPQQTHSIPSPPSLEERFTGDLAANILAVVVLLAMIATLVLAAFRIQRSPPQGAAPPSWLIPLLALLGLGVAGYLSYVEFNQVEAVCGPVGNCNTVQQSEYAVLFGFLPVGVLGLLGYLVILILWLAGELDLAAWNSTLNLGLFLVTLFGTLFSIYLTFLEPFVIGATCLWCLSSAVIITALFWLAAGRLSQDFETDPDESNSA